MPERGRALDLAAGTGPWSRWLARAGFEVLAVDVSPVGLERCSELAREAGLEIETLARDLRKEGLPKGRWDVIACTGYLQRDLFPQLPAHLEPGGVVVCQIATQRQLERHVRPPARFLVEPGELVRLCRPLEIVFEAEGWVRDSHVARVVARAPV